MCFSIMSDAKTTKNTYFQITNEKGRDVHTEFLYMLDRVDEENKLEHSNEFYLKLHGNKRNERNEMYRKKLTDIDMETFCLLLVNNTYITGIDFGYNHIGNEGAKTIGKLLQETKSLHSLVLRYNDIERDGATAIAKGIQVNDTLHLLNLEGNKMGVFGGLAIASALQVNTTLEELNLNNTEQETQSVIAFATALKANSAIKSLNLGRPLLHSQQEETTIHLAKLLEVNRTIRELYLSKHQMMNFGAKCLMEKITTNFALCHLDLSCNCISRDGMETVAAYLKGNPPLKHLNIGYNRAEDDGAIYLSEALACGNMSLRTLVLCNNSITGKGLCAIARSLSSNTTLTQLYIWGNTFDEETSYAFMELTTGDYPRLLEENTDVKSYVVDSVPHLARLYSPY